MFLQFATCFNISSCKNQAVYKKYIKGHCLYEKALFLTKTFHYYNL
jgi:hypothetical protein